MMFYVYAKQANNLVFLVGQVFARNRIFNILFNINCVVVYNFHVCLYQN